MSVRLLGCGLFFVFLMLMRFRHEDACALCGDAISWFSHPIAYTSLFRDSTWTEAMRPGSMRILPMARLDRVFTAGYPKRLFDSLA